MNQRIKSYTLTLSILCLVIFWSSCRKDFDYEASNGNLSFSKDTVFLDTVFANISSSTYSLKVYNTTDNDISIPTISLQNGFNSQYRINVDGQAGETFINTPVFANDSLYIFIETTATISENSLNEFLYTDAIIFDTGENEQSVSLVTLIQDAIFLYPNKDATGISETITLESSDGEDTVVNGFELEDKELNFTNEKPYVIYGYATIPKNKILNIDAGARVYFHDNSGLYAQANSSLQINGTSSSDNELLENEVVFEGDRLEPEYSTIPGQWGTIWLHKNSINNQINNLTVKNATIGLYIEGELSNTDNNLTLHNTQIYNSSNTNLFCKSSNITATNVVIGNAGGTSLHITNGGNYRFTHCTIANYWTSSFRSGTALQINNNILLENANFTNCIIDGNSNNELSLLDNENSDSFNYSFSFCMIKTTSNTDNESNFNTIYVNENASYINTSLNNFKISETSFAIDKADKETASTVPVDILGFNRTTNPDLGAYQHYIE